MNKQWTQFKEEFYKKFPDEDIKILDYIAICDIIRLIVSGVSNEEIAELLHDRVDYIESVAQEFLGFLGYEESLEFSPLQQYKRSNRTMFKEMCEKYLEIERKVDLYYARN